MKSFKSLFVFLLLIFVTVSSMTSVSFALEDGGTGSGDEISWGDLIGKSYDIEGTVLVNYRSDDKNIVVPDGITEIAADVFKDKSAKSITLPNSVKIIGETAFKNCPNLETVVMSSSLETIGSRAFTYCPSLKLLSLPDTVTSIASNAFNNSNNIVFVCSEGSYAFTYAASKKIPVLRYEAYIVSAPSFTKDGTYNTRTYYIDKTGNRVNVSDRALEDDLPITFEKWYLDTKLQCKSEADGSLTIRYISMLDNSYENCLEAGFEISCASVSATASTTVVNSSFFAEGVEVTPDVYGKADDVFFMVTSEYSGNVVSANPEITVRAFVKTSAGTLFGDTVSFNISDIIGG